MSRSFWQCPQYFSNVYVSQGCITTPEIRLVLFRQWIQNILGSSNSFWRFCDVGLSLGWFCSFCLMSVWVCVGFVVFACVCIQGCRMNGDIKGEKSARRSRITYRNEENRPFGCKKKKKNWPNLHFLFPTACNKRYYFSPHFYYYNIFILNYLVLKKQSWKRSAWKPRFTDIQAWSPTTSTAHFSLSEKKRHLILISRE